MSVRDQLNFVEKRTVTLANGAAPFQIFATGEALCMYSTGGQITVTIPSLLASDTGGGGPKFLSIDGLPSMKYSTTNLTPGDPDITVLYTPIWGLLDGVVTQFAVFSTSNSFTGEQDILLRADPILGTDFPNNSEVYVFQTSITYKWDSLPEHGGI